MDSAAAIRRTCVGIWAGPILKIIIDLRTAFFSKGLRAQLNRHLQYAAIDRNMDINGPVLGDLTMKIDPKNNHHHKCKRNSSNYCCRAEKRITPAAIDDAVVAPAKFLGRW